MQKTIHLTNENILTLKRNLGRTETDLIMFFTNLYKKNNEKYGLFHDNKQWFRNTHKNLSKKIGVSISTIQRALKKLSDLKIVLKNKFEEGKKYSGGADVSYFRIDFDTLSHLFHSSTMDEKKQSQPPSFCTTNSVILTEGVGHFDRPISYKQSLNFKNIQQDKGEDQKSNEKSITSPLQNHTSDFHTVSQSMFNIWNEIVLVKLEERNLNGKVVLTEKRKTYLNKAFTDFFHKDINQWKIFCEKIAHIDFLMGGGDNKFFATLDWTLKFSSIEKILEGKYDFNETKHLKYLEKKKENISHEQKLIDIVIPQTLPQWEQNLRHALVEEIGHGMYVSWVQPCSIEFSETQDEKPILLVTSSFVKDRFETDIHLQKAAERFSRIEYRKPQDIHIQEVLKQIPPQDLDGIDDDMVQIFLDNSEIADTLQSLVDFEQENVREVLSLLQGDIMSDIDANVIHNTHLITDLNSFQTLKKDLLQQRAMIAKNIGLSPYKNWFKHSRILMQEGGKILYVSSEFVKDTMQQRFSRIMDTFLDIQVVKKGGQEEYAFLSYQPYESATYFQMEAFNSSSLSI